jgi:hypothetical protein
MPNRTMPAMSETRAARFAAAYALLRAAADVADHWVQSDQCAQAKGATDAAPITAAVRAAARAHGIASPTPPPRAWS